MPILHLIDGGFRADDPGAAGMADEAIAVCSLLKRRAPQRQIIAIIGPRSAAVRASRLGLPPDLCIPARLGRPEAAWRVLLRAMKARGLPTVAHCWSRETVQLADRALAGICPIVATLQAAGPLPPITRINTYSRAAAEDFVRCGIPRAQVLVTPPPVEPLMRNDQRRADLRRRMGLAEKDLLIGLVGDPPAADAMRFVFLVGLLNVAGARVIGLASEHAGQIVRAQRLTWSHTAPRVILTPDPMWTLLPACDLAVLDSGGPGPTATFPPHPALAALPIARAHAAGVPVIAPRWADVAGLYPADADGCLAHNSTIPELARIALPLIDSPARRRERSDAVRAHITRLDPAAAYVSAISGLWQTLDEPAEIAP